MSNRGKQRYVQISLDQKRRKLKDYLLKKSLQFADCIQDDDQVKAKALYENPFGEEGGAEVQKAAGRAPITASKLSDIENNEQSDRQLKKISLRRSDTWMGGGDMAEVNIIKTVAHEPIFNRAELNTCVEKILATKENKKKDELGCLVVKFQIYMLVSLDDEERNVLHIACRSGSPLIEFIVEQAYKMEILHLMINELDNLGQTPLYMLCQKGYGKRMGEEVPKEHAHRAKYIKLLIQGSAEDPKGATPNANKVKKDSQKNFAKWLFRVSQVKYTPLHWLALWNDYQSIEYLLNSVDKNDPEQVKMIMSYNNDGLTPLDVAGVRQSNEAALIFLGYFKRNFPMIQWVFAEKTSGKTNRVDLVHKPDAYQDMEFPWKLVKVHAKSLTEVEAAYGRIFYWSGFYGEQLVCQFFMKKLGVSPFMKLFASQNVVGACVKGCQYELLRYLIEDTR